MSTWGSVPGAGEAYRGDRPSGTPQGMYRTDYPRGTPTEVYRMDIKSTSPTGAFACGYGKAEQSTDAVPDELFPRYGVIRRNRPSVSRVKS